MATCEIYKQHFNEFITLPPSDRYEKEERDKKLRRIREEQQRIAIAKQQRLGAVAAAAASRGTPPPRPGVAPPAGRGRGVTISRGGGAGPSKGGGSGRGRGPAGGHAVAAGPRPSFQYRDGAFICDLCKKSFSDGNDMVAHWKSHVKQQQLSKHSNYVEPPARSSASGSKRGRGRPPGRPVAQAKAAKTHTTSRGRPITSKQAGRRGRAAASAAATGKKAKKSRRDKGKPRWTAYLVWSSRRRKEIQVKQQHFVT
jgi:hypothetical protein